MDKIFIEQLEISCIIGIYDWERTTKQKVVIDLWFPANIKKAAKSDKIKDAVNYKEICKFTIDFVSHSRYGLIETLAETLAKRLLKAFKLPRVGIRLCKPGALRGAKNVGVEIERRRK